MNKKYAHVEQIIAKLDNDFNLDQTDYVPRIAAWVIEALSILKCTKFEYTTKKIEIKNSILKYFIYFLLIPFVLLFVFGFVFTFLLSVIVGLIFTFFRFDAFGLGGTPSVIIIVCTVTIIALYIKMLIEKINFKNKL